jgi:two-component system, NarL family, invasion response regulator UvrY
VDKSAADKRRVTVLLADDHPLLLMGFAQALANYEIEVVGQTTSASQAVEDFDRLKPDVLVLDIRFGDRMTGFDTAAAVLQQHPDARIVFLSQFDDDTLIKEAYRLGARAFVTKDRDPKDLAAAIARANESGLFFLPEVAERLAGMAIHGETSPRALLDKRQLEVFTYMARGCTNTEIAAALHLSPKTISNESHAIKLVLGVTRQADLTMLAVKARLIEP